MKVTTHGDYLIKITRWWSMNCYLVREDDGFTLVDTGYPNSQDGILQAAREAGQPIRRIVLTHAHVDHVGSLDALHAALPEAEVMISERDARFMTGDMSLDPDEPQTEPKGGYPVCSTVPARLLHPGDRVCALEVIAAPGHTPGHVAFMDTRDGTLIAGDAFQTLGGVAVSGKLKPLFPLPALATWHKPTALASARALAALDPQRLAVGHGRVIEQPQAAMARAIREAEASFGA